MSVTFQVRAGLLLNHMKRAAFCSDIRDLYIEIEHNIMKTSAIGVTNDRLATIRTHIDKGPEKRMIIGIPEVRNAINRVMNFKPDDILILEDDGTQLKILREKPKKSYILAGVADLKAIKSKSVYEVSVNTEEKEFDIEVVGKPSQRAGGIEAITTLDNLSDIKAIFKDKDVFTDETELSIMSSGEIHLKGKSDEDVGDDIIEATPKSIPKNDIVRGYSGLIEVIKSLNPKADITLYAGTGTVSLVITESLDIPGEKYDSVYTVMSRNLRWS
ncbi:MAG: hypothetical protein KAS66_08265 [Candidatus Omnitrophica bacterium]|nr:hypothetical protein [Candidatus Omnitrophota bacterium]